mmetsp:Transcript_90867/g.231239  ORF Transcript_90867/g.231239 Transcript_90867/m.231239 type:complete len:221 (+) Transcript_90867:608-1270(+)
MLSPFTIQWQVLGHFVNLGADGADQQRRPTQAPLQRDAEGVGLVPASGVHQTAAAEGKPPEPLGLELPQARVVWVVVVAYHRVVQVRDDQHRLVLGHVHQAAGSQRPRPTQLRSLVVGATDLRRGIVPLRARTVSQDELGANGGDGQRGGLPPWRTRHVCQRLRVPDAAVAVRAEVHRGCVPTGMVEELHGSASNRTPDCPFDRARNRRAPSQCKAHADT